MMVFHEVKHVIVEYKFMKCMSMQFIIIHNVVINNDECSHDDMQDLACGLFSMIL